MNVRKKRFNAGAGFLISLKFIKGVRKFKRRKGIRDVVSWAAYQADQARMHKLCFPEEPYQFHSRPKIKK